VTTRQGRHPDAAFRPADEVDLRIDSVFSGLPRNYLDAQAAKDSFTLSGARVVGSIVTRNTVSSLGSPESETPPEVEAFLVRNPIP
jgi:hypothetical protein